MNTDGMVATAKIARITDKVIDQLQFIQNQLLVDGTVDQINEWTERLTMFYDAIKDFRISPPS